MTTITIASIEQKPKKWVIHTTEGRKLGCWANNIGKFGLEQGSTFEVETETNDYGTLITKATRIAGGPNSGASIVSPGAGKGNGASSYRPTSPEDAERMFVCATLTALIKAGEVKNDKAQLFHTTNMLRLLYQHTFGAALPAEQQRAA